MTVASDFRIAAPVRYEDSVGSLITADLEVHLANLLTLMSEEASAQGLETSSIEISRFDDPETERIQIVVAQWVMAKAETALAYWDRLGAAIRRWKETLSAESRQAVSDWFAIEVHWDAPTTSV